MKGQWLGRFDGNNVGNILVDVDEVDGIYLAYVVIQADDGSLPIVFTRFQTKDTALPISLTVNVFCLDPRTLEPTEWDKVASLFPQITLPKTADATFSIVANRLEITWSSPNGGGRASLPRSEAGKESVLEPISVRTWSEFKEYVDGLPSRRFAFRGQQSNKWRLRTSFHRTGRANLERFSLSDIPAVSKHLSAQTKHLFNLNDQLQYGAFVSLIQHHGYPTPLLDWTHSPFVAAFFAYRGLRRNAGGGVPDGKVRLFQFSIRDWVLLPQNLKLSPLPPHVSVLDAIALENARMLPQQGISTVTNVDDIETYIKSIEKRRDQVFLQAIDLPQSEHPAVARDLAMMGITAGSLLPGLDGVCEQLREQFFPVE